ncbi:MAG TPA: aminoglycoside phosphotransferase family protein [Herpetosiphonaceae bacterium]|nr:aminoglycoside phosphotransferase family protein [Herpetosiphonaceae bacterium]
MEQLPPALNELCRRHHLDLIGVPEGRAGGSELVALVRDRHGRHLVLKQTMPWAVSEITALRAWSATGLAASFVAILEPTIYLAEWLPGPSVADVPLDQPIDARAIGRMLRGLHQVPPPGDLLDIRERFGPGIVIEWRALPTGMRAVGAQVAARLYRDRAASAVFLHGDLVPSNIILTGSGPKVIDPLGCRGPAAWDIAQLAVAAEGRERHRLLGELLAGYEETIPLLAELFAWMTLFYLQKNLVAERTAFVAHLRPLAAALVALGDPAHFLHRYLDQSLAPDRP